MIAFAPTSCFPSTARVHAPHSPVMTGPSAATRHMPVETRVSVTTQSASIGLERATSTPRWRREYNRISSVDGSSLSPSRHTVVDHETRLSSTVLDLAWPGPLLATRNSSCISVWSRWRGLDRCSQHACAQDSIIDTLFPIHSLSTSRHKYENFRDRDVSGLEETKRTIFGNRGSRGIVRLPSFSRRETPLNFHSAVLGGHFDQFRKCVALHCD